MSTDGRLKPTLISTTGQLCAFPPLRSRVCLDPPVGRGIGQEPVEVVP